VAVAVLALAGGGWWWMHRAPGPVQNVSETAALPAPPPAAVQTAPATAPEVGVVDPTSPPAPVDQALTNDNIIQMMEAKVAPAVILSQIRSSKTAFTLSAKDVIRLSQAGVPGMVIEAMRNPKAAPSSKAAAVPASPAPAPAPISTPVVAATATPAPAPAVSAPAPAAVSVPSSIVAVTLTDGMPFSVLLAEDLPQNAEEGRPLRFTVARDVRVGDLVAIAKGATVTGEITQAGRKGTFGIGGSKMTMRLMVADAVDGHKYRVRAQSARAADGKNERPVETTTKPKNKELAASAGTEYIAYIDGDVTVSVKK
jgi:hypothetical protein